MRKILDTLLVLVLTLSVTKGQNLNCNFDANNTCSWTQVTTDKANWLLHKGPTASQNTGPSSDHTTGSSSGYYIYYETTGGSKDDIAQLQSPRISVGSRSQCFSFWFFMYGQTVDALNVYIKSGNRLGSPVWTRSHTQGRQWKQAVINIRNKRNVQIVLEAVKGRGYLGDIAVDDIFYTSGTCGQAGSVTPAPGSTGTVTCNFEAASICGYQQDKTDNFDWDFSQGRTTTFGTGPPNDHTLNTYYGHYMMMEASGKQANTKARLISPTFRNTRTQCLRFWYNMNGQNVGSLNVYVKGRSLGNSIWQVSNHQGAQWNVGQVTVRGNSQTRSIVFEAVRGTGGDKGDIAIDDVSIKRGGCPAPGSCNFETDFCTWTQGIGDDFDWTRRKGNTTTGGTGPTTDHTRHNGQGTYAFIEASSPRRPGDKAQLISESFNRASRKCFRFYYNMKGAQMGTLNVYVTINGVKKLMWTLSGDQGGSWKFGRIPISSPRYDYMITIEGVRGSGETGDMAIDDLYLYTSSCSVSPSNARPPATTTTKPPTSVSTTQPTTKHVHQSTVSCTFDYDLCGWTQLTTDQFNFFRQLGGTIAPGTGPSRDHTSGKGWYLYATTTSVTANQAAQIKSPQIRPGGKQQCVSFWYHMYGANVGTLNVYIQTLPSLGSPTWTRTSSQGNVWNQGTVTLPTTGTYYLVFEVKNGKTFPGDIAIDDINLHPCSGVTPSPGATTAKPGSSTNLGARTCTFERSNICGYTQDRTDRFNWNRDNSGTSTQGTGPATDHTYGTRRGHYMYIETSYPRKRGDIARLLSPAYTDSSDICVKFWYHMYGDGIGTLNVYAMHGTARGQAIFSMSGNQGNKWVVGSATVPQSTASGGYKVVFEGVVGTNYRGDIAVDDVSFTTGACGSPGNCDFEHGLCTWTNTRTGDNFDWTQGSRSTGTGGTGPSSDHTLGTTGHYMYIETSSPRKPGDVARLVSQSFAPTASGRCISFWYNMYGRTIDTLRVIVQVPGTPDQTIWQLSGAQGNSWLQGQAPINQTKSYQVVFEGRRGQSFSGDIAIDDISFTTSVCGVFPTKAAPQTPSSTATTPTTTSTPGPFNCNFDPGLCGWSQDKTDNFDWTRTNRATPSTGTGPRADHTTGHGYYIYIETSGKSTGNKARLIGPQVSASSSGNKCMTLWYFMYGQNVDRLNVYAQYGLTLPASPLWTKRGTQGNRWNQASITITASRPFNVVLEGIRGNGYKGDIAIDDLSIVDGPCAGATTPNPQSAATSCNFESSSICGFTQDHTGGDKFDWSRDNAGTQSVRTGPTTDHTLGTALGHYMYIEASAPRRRGDKARLNSPIYSKSTTASCLKFWYHMYGRNMGTLNVYAVLSGRFQKIWTKSGNQGNKWIIASATVPVSPGTYQIVFEGIVGTGYQGDLAIDDYSITTGGCSTQGSSTCNFDNQNLCTWTNDHTNDQFDWQLRHGSTPSGQTGPTNDHTKGNAQGYYIFIETSSPRIVGDRAWLVSESFSTGGPNCLSFWYNMNGNSIGALRVWVWSQTGARTPVWELKGLQGQNWLMGRVAIPAQTTSYKIIMEGTRGQSVTGDIALDDISFANTTNCPLTPQNAVPTATAVTASTLSTKPTTTTPKLTTPTTLPTTTRPTGGTGYSCDFTYDICGWTQDKTDQYDWSRKRGPTMTVGTGPRGDHTTGSGYYMYIETSSPRNSGDKARLIGPRINGNGQPMCFTFWYNMFGDHVASMNIYVKKGNNLGSAIWTRSGAQGNSWRQAQVQLTPSGASMIVIEGVRGVSYRGDIAIDDTNVTSGACSGATTPAPQTIGQLNCNFESKCSYTNEKGTDDFDWTRFAGSTASSGTGPFSDHTLGTRAGKV